MAQQTIKRRLTIEIWERTIVRQANGDPHANSEVDQDIADLGRLIEAQHPECDAESVEVKTS